MSAYKNIFMKTEPISPKEMQEYLSGNLSMEEMHKIEQKLSADEFSAEATNGFENNPAALAGLAGLNEKFAAKHGLNNSGLSATQIVLLSIAGATLVAVLSIFTYTQLNQPSEPQIAQNNISEKEDNKPEVIEQKPQPVIENIDETIQEESYDDAVILIEEEVEKTDLIEKEKIIDSKDVLEKQPETVVDVIEEPIEIDIDVEPIDDIDIKPIETKIETKAHSNVKVLYYHDFKVIDYSGLYTKQIKIRNKEIPSGRNVVYNPSTKDNPNSIVGPYTFIPYEDFLDDAMKKFSKNDFKGALKDLKLIIKLFPDDVNAHFYGGLCYYNLGKWSYAQNYFTTVADNYIYTFDQEADYYKALALKENGQTTEAEELFNKIVEEGKFYAEHARKELRNL